MIGWVNELGMLEQVTGWPITQENWLTVDPINSLPL